MSQSTGVAIAVIIAFAAGAFFGRTVLAPSSSPSNAPVETTARPPAPSAPTAFPMAGAMGAADPSAAPAAPHPMPMAMPSGADSNGKVSGSVAEIIQVPNFTYLRLTTDHGDEWAAVPTTNALTVGQQAGISHPAKMAAFTSKTLNRTFDEIWFGELAKN